MEDTNLILNVQTLSTQLGRIADSLERIERKLNTEPYHEKVETDHNPEHNPPYSTHALNRSPQAEIVKTYTYEEFRRNAQ